MTPEVMPVSVNFTGKIHLAATIMLEKGHQNTLCQREWTKHVRWIGDAPESLDAPVYCRQCVFQYRAWMKWRQELGSGGS